MSNETIDLIQQLNDLMEDLFSIVEYSEDDNEYKNTVHGGIDYATAEIENIIKLNPDITDNLYLYGTNYFYLNNNIYASTHFKFIEKNEFIQYCTDKGLDYDNYIYTEVYAQNFSSYMERLTMTYIYKLPTAINYTFDNKGYLSDNYWIELSKFAYIDVLKLKDSIK